MAAPMRARNFRSVFSKLYAFRQCSSEATPKVKETRRQKLYNLLNGYYQDYKAVALETKDDIKNHPIKTGFYLLGLGVLGLFHKTVPDEDSFKDILRESGNELALVSKLIRNPTSDGFVRDIVRYENADRLRYTHLGLFSIIWYSDHGKNVDTYEAHCPHLQPKWRDYKDRIIDVGLLGQWVWIQQYMDDYDVNPEEWTETAS